MHLIQWDQRELTDMGEISSIFNRITGPKMEVEMFTSLRWADCMMAESAYKQMVFIEMVQKIRERVGRHLDCR